MKEWLLSFLLSLPVYAEDAGDSRKRAQLENVASAVDAVAGEDRTMAALLLSTGWVETGYSLRIHDGHCQTWECDHGRARGPWQVWKNGRPKTQWALMRGLEHTPEQAQAAAEVLRAGLKKCGNVRGAIARYVGLPCSARNAHLEVRFLWFKRAQNIIRKGEL